MLWLCLGRQSSEQRMPNISLEFRLKYCFVWFMKMTLLCATNTFVAFIWHFDTIKYDSEITELRSSFWSCVHNDLRIREIYATGEHVKAFKIETNSCAHKRRKKYANTKIYLFREFNLWAIKWFFYQNFISSSPFLQFYDFDIHIHSIQSSIGGPRISSAIKWLDVSKFLADAIHVQTSWVHSVQMFLIDNIILLSNSNFQPTSHWWILRRVIDVDLNRRWSSTINK